MTRDPLPPNKEMEWVKKIGSRYFRFDTIIAVDDTNPSYLVVYFYGGNMKINVEWERVEFLKWMNTMKTIINSLGYHAHLGPTSFQLGIW